MSNPTTPFSWQMPQATDLVTDLPADFEVFGQAVATSMADLLGGTTGQILAKASATDMDFTWIANDQGDITNVTATSPLTGGGTSGAITVGIQDASTSQKGSVQLSDSTSTTSSILAATPTAVKSAYDLANGAIAKTLVTTTGDTIYASSANTPARLGIGTTGQVLTVSGGIPTWSAVATNKTIAQIASGTMPAASSLSLTGLSSYDTLIVRLDSLTWATNNASIMVTINADTGANYELVGGYNQTTYSTGFGATATNYFYAGFGAASQDRTNATNYRFYVFENCKAAGFTNATVQESFTSSGGDTPNTSSVGIYKSAAAVSSIQFKTSTGNNYSAGNYVIWGG